MDLFQLAPIGILHTPFVTSVGMPLQTVAAKGVKATIELFPEYIEGLADVAGFSHLWLFSYLHKNESFKLRVTPFLDDQPRGVFATRSPRRPNFIGLSLVRLIAVEGNVLQIEDIDLLDGTPLLDIKPYLPQFDHHNSAQNPLAPDEEVRIGWFVGRIDKVFTTRANDRMK